MNVNEVEAIWLLVTVFAVALTVDNLIDASYGWRVVRNTGRVREIQARANVRAEAVRLVINLALLTLVIPALFRPGDTALSPALLVIMAVPVGMAVNSHLDRLTRKTIAGLV